MTRLNRFLFACCLLLTQHLQAQTLFSYGNKTVTRQEFLDAFAKNNTVSPVTEKAYVDYLELYLRYKLKVQAARDLRLDTLKEQQQEMADFRQQISIPYFSSDSALQSLVQEAFDHSGRNIRLSHIYIGFEYRDTAAAWAKVQKALADLKKGRPFAETALAYSEDPAVKQNQGDIGWISAFLMPYPLEKLAYETPVGKISPVYKSRNAYHIVYPAASRPAPGNIQVAQIFLALPAYADEATLHATQQKADSLYRLLLQGADFGVLALQNSEDNNSFQSQGVLTAFGPGTYDAVFEENAFALDKDNSFCKPFRSARGIHILKRIQAFPPLRDPSNEADYNEMKMRVQNDARIKVAADAATARAARQTGFRENRGISNTAERFTLAFFNNDRKGMEELSDATLLASLGSVRVTGKQYKDWLTSNADALARVRPALYVDEIYHRFLDEQLLNEYRQHLEKYEPAFASQWQEFQNGNLVFAVMQSQVWDKAALDEAGLKKYYQDHANRYTWRESIRGIIYTLTDSAAAWKFRNALQRDPAARGNLLAAETNMLSADSGRFEIAQLPALRNGSTYTKGLVSEPLFNRESLSSSFVLVQEVFPAGQPRSFEEARGLVLNDYQLALEETWIAELKKKYPFKLNETAWKALVK